LGGFLFYLFQKPRVREKNTGGASEIKQVDDDGDGQGSKRPKKLRIVKTHQRKNNETVELLTQEFVGCCEGYTNGLNRLFFWFAGWLGCGQLRFKIHNKYK
jgi:hypothetical protein